MGHAGCCCCASNGTLASIDRGSHGRSRQCPPAGPQRGHIISCSVLSRRLQARSTTFLCATFTSESLNRFVVLCLTISAATNRDVVNAWQVCKAWRATSSTEETWRMLCGESKHQLHCAVMLLTPLSEPYRSCTTESALPHRCPGSASACGSKLLTSPLIRPPVLGRQTGNASPCPRCVRTPAFSERTRMASRLHGGVGHGARVDMREQKNEVPSGAAPRRMRRNVRTCLNFASPSAIAGDHPRAPPPPAPRARVRQAPARRRLSARSVWEGGPPHPSLREVRARSHTAKFGSPSLAGFG